MNNHCLVSLLTPVGRGAVASIFVVGPDANRCVSARFKSVSGRPLIELPAGRIHFGRWRTGAGPGEELVVCNRSEWVEIHCHGGTAAARAVMGSLVEDGSREVTWTEFARHLAPDDFSAEARIALAQARTERTAAILLDQLRGALREEWRIIESLAASGRSSEAIQRLEQLRSRSQVGLHLTEPYRVVLCGPPNAGKSSLINALLGYQRSVIYHQPGTTRDVLSSHTALDGWPVELSDTAGLREATDPIEAAGIDRARHELQRADLAIIVFDASQPQRELEVQLKSRLRKAIAVYNKCDLVRSGTPTNPGLTTSALTGEGMENLLTAISQALVPDAPAPGTPLPFTRRQVELLEQWRAALARDATVARVCSFSGDH